MKPVKHRKETILRNLRKELHYWQMMVRMDIKAARASRANVIEVAARMREVQKRPT